MPPPHTFPVTLESGTRLGSFVVIAQIGAGGMGEVYRARDSKLNRDVALKVLPHSVAADADRLARLKREAQALASLSHPHIGHIYGIEDTNGVLALVLELVEGPTLAEHIERSPQGTIPVEEALALAAQIADALDTAHERGIVHRDLKPANIKVTPDGVVKVLDFGLAKTGGASDLALVDASQSPTLDVGGTREGMIMGTLTYMSPEQARGQAVDKRADVWAFGCVLYEMLTGRAPFARDTVSDTLAAILEHKPDWEKLPKTTPAAVRRLLERCLAKPQRQRLRDLGDAQLEIADGLAAPTASMAPQTNVSSARTSMWWVAALVGTAIVTGAAVWRLKPQPAMPAVRADGAPLGHPGGWRSRSPLMQAPSHCRLTATASLTSRVAAAASRSTSATSINSTARPCRARKAVTTPSSPRTRNGWGSLPAENSRKCGSAPESPSRSARGDRRNRVTKLGGRRQHPVFARHRRPASCACLRQAAYRRP